jgi:hypothetical protein
LENRVLAEGSTPLDTLGGAVDTGWDITPRIGTGFLNLANPHFE